VSAAGVVVPAGTQVLTRPPGTAVPSGAPIPPTSPAYQAALNAGAVVFETVEAALLDADLDELTFYTWGDEDCCLPAGATGATLLGHHPRLKAGDVLLLAEVRGPVTGATADADPAHRWPVRVTQVVPDSDPALPDAANPTDVTEISWDTADALPFPLCLTAPGVAEAVSVAWGNVVLAEHGRTVTDTGIGPVPAPTLAYRTPPGVPCTDEPARPVPVRFRPTLVNAPLTRSLAPVPVGLFDDDATPARVADLDAGTFSPALHDWLLGHGIVFHRSPVTVSGATGGGVGAWAVSDGQTVVCLTEDGAARLHATGRPAAASAVMSGTAGSAAGSPADARPAIGLAAQPPTGPVVPWTARADLLGSAPDAPDFVVETEHDGTVRLRFARGAPAEGTTFTATYRVGNGVAGNVGADSLVHVVTSDGSVLGATNPLPAAGGVQPESADEIRRNAPEAFKVQQRAVTEADWAEVATRDPAIQRAAATWRWTGSWHTVFLTVDPAGTETPPPTFADDVRAELERYRLAGYDLDVDRPRYVPLEVGMLVCVEPDYLRSEVGSAVLTELAGLFAPDNFSFAQPVYLSPIYAAAQSVPGVASVTVQVFQRQHEPASSGLTGGLLSMGRLEIARLDNDPNFPERGVLSLSLGGGR
jgi:predicted phage baseplate assembly protein